MTDSDNFSVSTVYREHDLVAIEWEDSRRGAYTSDEAERLAPLINGEKGRAVAQLAAQLRDDRAADSEEAEA